MIGYRPSVYQRSNCLFPATYDPKTIPREIFTESASCFRSEFKHLIILTYSWSEWVGYTFFTLSTLLFNTILVIYSDKNIVPKRCLQVKLLNILMTDQTRHIGHYIEALLRKSLYLECRKSIRDLCYSIPKMLKKILRITCSNNLYTYN